MLWSILDNTIRPAAPSCPVHRYVVSCQVFSKMQSSKKKADKDKAEHIKMLAKMYPGLRIAYVEEVKGHFYSVLSKHNGQDMEEEYRVRVSLHQR